MHVAHLDAQDKLDALISSYPSTQPVQRLPLHLEAHTVTPYRVDCRRTRLCALLYFMMVHTNRAGLPPPTQERVSGKLTCVDVSAKVNSEAWALWASFSFAEVLNAQPLLSDEVEEVQPLPLLDASEHMLLRAPES